jgi:hypothetical protein
MTVRQNNLKQQVISPAKGSSLSLSMHYACDRSWFVLPINTGER